MRLLKTLGKLSDRNTRVIAKMINIKKHCKRGYFPSPMAANLSFLLNSSGLYILLPSMRTGCLMFLLKSSVFRFLNSFHSVTIMQQSASFMHSMGDKAYLILFLKIDLAFGMAAGSYAVIFAPSLRSWFMIGMDLASRMSSVFGLKDKPKMAMFLLLRLPIKFLHS